MVLEAEKLAPSKGETPPLDHVRADQRLFNEILFTLHKVVRRYHVDLAHGLCLTRSQLDVVDVAMRA
jgi:hypothetical protein